MNTKKLKILMCLNISIQIKVGYDPRTIAISVTDPFGMIEENKFYRYIHKVSYEQDNINLIDTEEKRCWFRNLKYFIIAKLLFVILRKINEPK